MIDYFVPLLLLLLLYLTEEYNTNMCAYVFVRVYR